MFRDPGLFAVYASLTPGTEHGKVEALIMAEYEKIKKEGVTDEEVEKANKATFLIFLKKVRGLRLAKNLSINE